jgi:hypothetical protein
VFLPATPAHGLTLACLRSVDSETRSWLRAECTGTFVTLWTGEIRYKSLAPNWPISVQNCSFAVAFDTSQQSRPVGNMGIPKGFPKSVGSRLPGFPCFPYSVISMDCFWKRAFENRSYRQPCFREHDLASRPAVCNPSLMDRGAGLRTQVEQFKAWATSLSKGGPLYGEWEME